MIKGSNVAPYLPRGQLDVIGSNVSPLIAGLVVDQIGSGKVAVFKKNAVDKVTIDENGDVGIGTTNPINPLHISNRGGIRIDDASSNIFLLRQMNNSIFGGEYSHITPFNTTTNTIQQLVVDGLPVLINPLSGNVGIGTTNPQATLHVNGTIYNPGGIVQTQMYQNYFTSAITATTTLAATAVTITITPKFSNSKILITFYASMSVSNLGIAKMLYLYRNGTNITSGTYGWSYTQYEPNASAVQPYVYEPMTNIFVDTPGTITSLAYTVWCKSSSSSTPFIYQNSYASLVVQEIAQ
jgi:hypothetical protein